MGHSSSDQVKAIQGVDWDGFISEEPLMAYGHLQEFATQIERDTPASSAINTVAKVCGMMLNPDRWDRPYSPLMQIKDRRTALPEDLTYEEIEFLSQLLPTLPHTLVTAQIADVISLRSSDKARRFEYAKEAVTRWITVGLPDGLPQNEEQGWRRAIEISLRFRLNDEVDQLETLALERIRAGEVVSAWQVAQMVRQAGIGRDSAVEIASVFVSGAQGIEDLHLRREVLAEARGWLKIEADEEAVARIDELIGDLWWEEAKARRSDSHHIARDCYGNAYNQYRRVRRSLRSTKTVKRIARLPRKIREEGQLSLDEMQFHESGPIDLTPLRELADHVLSEEDTIRALAKWFANAPLDSIEAAQDAAITAMREHPVQHLFSRTTLDADGRTIHKSTSPQARGGIPGEVWAEIVRNLSLKIGVLAQGYIWPVLAKMSTERKLTISDFRVMIRASPFVPPNQEWFFATALYNGYYGRLAESIYMLVPAMEACVRACLQRAGIETRNIRADDTEIEPGLSALMELDGVDQALTPDLAWHIRALYCGPLGPNLRNRMAHGLLTEEESKGSSVLYAWWLAFRLAFIPYFNLVMRESD